MTQPVRVTCRRGSYPGIKVGRTVAYDFVVAGRYTVSGRDETQRVFVLLDDHIQLQQPRGLPAELAGWWYEREGA